MVLDPGFYFVFTTKADEVFCSHEVQQYQGAHLLMAVHKSKAEQEMKPSDQFYIGPDFIYSVNKTSLQQRHKHIFQTTSVHFTLQPNTANYFQATITDDYVGSLTKPIPEISTDLIKQKGKNSCDCFWLLQHENGFSWFCDKPET